MGRSLAFYAGPRGDHNIYTIGLDGKDLRQLTQGGDNLAPSYSPDGQWIAFTSFRDGNNEIYAIHPDGIYSHPDHEGCPPGLAAPLGAVNLD